MSFKLPENVQETSITEGTGTIDLLGAVTGAKTFASQMANNDTTIYAIQDQSNLEIGFGAYLDSSGSQLQRTEVYYSTNGDAFVDWIAGTRNVYVGPAAVLLRALLDPAMGVGFVVKTSARYYINRILAAGGSNLVIGNANGVNGNPTITLSQGPGSGLDSDTVDGKNAAEFLLSSGLGSTVQAWNNELQEIADSGGPPTDGFIVGDVSGVWDVVDRATARTQLGLGALATVSSVDQSHIDASAVGQGELKTSTEEVTMGAGSFGNVILSVGEYGLWPTIRVSDTTSINPIVGVFNTKADTISPSGSSTAYVFMDNTAGAQTQTWAKFRYIIASPPFDLGDGEIPLFVFAVVEKSSGNIVSATTSKVPPWAYNGPTNIMPTNYNPVGKPLKKVWVPAVNPTEQEIIRLMGMSLAHRKDTPGYWEEVEVTQGMKNADIDLIPHPYMSFDTSLYEVILLDPVSSVMETFAEMIDEGESVTELLTNGSLNIGNTAIVRAAPPGVMPVSFSIK